MNTKSCDKGTITTGTGRPTPRARLFRIAVLAAVASMLSLTTLGASQASASTNWEYVYFEGRHLPAALADRDGNGNIDLVWFDLDNDRKWDAAIYNSQGSDSVLERLVIDTDENRIWDYWAEDTDGWGGFDAIYANRGGEWVRTSTVPITIGPFHPISGAYVASVERFVNAMTNFYMAGG